MNADRPTLRLKPKVDARKIRWGFPWVYNNDIVWDRRSKAIEAGTIVTLQDSDRGDLATATVNIASKLAVRILDRDIIARIDQDWITGKVQAAWTLRQRLYDAPFFRLIHAEGDGLPGVIVDVFGEYAVLQANAVWADQRKMELARAIQSVTGIGNIFLNGTGRSRQAEGLEDLRTPLIGHGPDQPVPVVMNGATYLADITGGQKTGLFYDQRPNHCFAKGLSKGASVLDVFCHVGGFGLAAMAGGAASVDFVDASDPALELARQGGFWTSGTDALTFHKGDAFDQMARMAEDGRRFDMVVCDPPAFAPSKTALEKGLRAYEKVARQAADLVMPGGYLVLCSCSHAATLDKFRNSCLRGIGRAERGGRLIHQGGAGGDHPQHLSLADGGYLKALFFVLD